MKSYLQNLSRVALIGALSATSVYCTANPEPSEPSVVINLSVKPDPNLECHLEYILRRQICKQYGQELGTDAWLSKECKSATADAEQFKSDNQRGILLDPRTRRIWKSYSATADRICQGDYKRLEKVCLRDSEQRLYSCFLNNKKEASEK